MDETSLGSITSAFAFGNQWQGSLRALHFSMSQNAGDLINTISINTAIGVSSSKCPTFLHSGGAVECWYCSPLNFYVVRFTWNFYTSWDLLRRLYRRWPASVDDGLQLVELSDQDWPETRLGQLLFSGQCLLPDRSFFVSTSWWLFDDIKGFDFSNWHHFWVVPNKQPWDSADSDKPLWIVLKHPDKCVIVITALNWKGVCACVPTIWNLEMMTCHHWCLNLMLNQRVCFFCVSCYCLEPAMFDFGISLQIS